MSRQPITYPCDDCGAVVSRVRRSDEPLVCIDCGIGRALAYNDRQHAERLARRDTLRGRRDALSSALEAT